jgi:hypothetical protein
VGSQLVPKQSSQSLHEALLLLRIVLYLLWCIARQLDEPVPVLYHLHPPCLRERNSFFFSLINPAGMWWLLKLSVNSCQVIASSVAWAVV